MTLVDLSAIDKLLDFYGENIFVEYNDNIFKLSNLKDFLENNNINFSIDCYLVNSNGIFDFQKNQIVSIYDKNNFHKDDLNNI